MTTYRKRTPHFPAILFTGSNIDETLAFCDGLAEYDETTKTMRLQTDVSIAELGARLPIWIVKNGRYLSWISPGIFEREYEEVTQ